MPARDLTNQQIDAFDAASRAAWLDSMDDTERMVCWYPVGLRHRLVLVAYIKRIVQTERMPRSLQLRFLEVLDRMVGPDLSAAQAAALAPASDAMVEIIEEARKAGADSADVLSSWQVFWTLIDLNPSLLDAIRRHSPMRA